MIRQVHIVLATLLLSGGPVFAPGKSDRPQPPPQQYLRALRLIGEGKFAPALDELHKLLEARPEYFRAYEKVVDLYARRGRLRRAGSFFSDLAARQPQKVCLPAARGLIALRQKKFSAAFGHLREALSRCPASPLLFRCFAEAADGSGSLAQAERFCRKLARERPQNAAVRYGLAAVQVKKRAWEQAEENLQQALRLNPELPDAYRLLGTVYFFTGRQRQFLRAARRGRAVALRRNDPEWECTFLGRIGLAHYNLAHFRAAEDTLKQALRLARRLGCRAEQQRALANLSIVCRETGRYSEGIRYQRQALQLARELQDLLAEALALRNLGTFYYFQNRIAPALRYYKRALAMFTDLNNPRLRGLTLWSLGLAYWKLNDLDSALSYYSGAVRLAQETGDSFGQERYLTAMAEIYWELGNYSRAQALLEQSLPLARRIGDRIGEEQALLNFGLIFEALGDLPTAVVYQQKALKIAREVGHRSEVITLLNNLGSLLGDLGNYTEALARFKQALPIAAELHELRMQSLLLSNVGAVQFSLGNYGEAERWALKGLRLARQTGDTEGQLDRLILLAETRMQKGDLAGAEKFYSPALALLPKVKDPRYDWWTFTGLGDLYARRNRLKKALATYQKALAAVERVRAELRSEAPRTSFMQDKVSLYGRIIRILLRLQHREPGADYGARSFQVAERARARTLLEMISRSQLFQKLREIPAGLKQERLLNRLALESAYEQLRKEEEQPDSSRSPERVALLKQEVLSLERKKAAIERRIFENFPRYGRLASPHLLSLREVQRLVLKKHQLLLEYFWGSKTVFVWAVTRDSAWVDSLTLSPDSLRSLLAAASPLFARNPSGRPPSVLDYRSANFRTDVLFRLYRELVARPAGKLLAGARELILVPDGPLFAFPFEALVVRRSASGVRYLAGRLAVFYAPSASLLNPALRRTGTTSREWLAFANPALGRGAGAFPRQLAAAFPGRIFRGGSFRPLPFAEQEIQEIGKTFRRPVRYSGKRATEARFKQLAGQFRYLHLATHFVVDDREPMFSKILLAPSQSPPEDGLLQTYEIYNLRLNAELAVLSGCSSGLGAYSRGEGMLGLSRAFLYAGVPKVLISLWPVEDEHAAEFTVQFYRFLRQGMPAQEALRAAKLEFLRRGGKVANPFYWAPFVLFGR